MIDYGAAEGDGFVTWLGTLWSALALTIWVALLIVGSLWLRPSPTWRGRR